jgi:uncharacterized protein (UPF0332 family)
MSPEQLEDLVRYRLGQAAETIAEALLLRDAGAFRGAVSRAYYAMFYALLGLLAARQLGTSKHSGAIAMFDREFVRTGIFGPELSRSLHLAFQRRQECDYGEVVHPDLQTANESIAEAKRFVTDIRSYLAPHG